MNRLYVKAKKRTKNHERRRKILDKEYEKIGNKKKDRTSDNTGREVWQIVSSFTSIRAYTKTQNRKTQCMDGSLFYRKERERQENNQCGVAVFARNGITSYNREG
ncbi:MAG: hypothetical protein LBO67_07025 [Spirochaetaceae bacterium]|nr:hypothetical protein [Spirochaetaceae bacterium]